MAKLPDPDDEHTHDDQSAGINGLSAHTLREFCTLRGDMISQTRTLFIGIPSMIGAMAVLLLGFVEFAIGR